MLNFLSGKKLVYFFYRFFRRINFFKRERKIAFYPYYLLSVYVSESEVYCPNCELSFPIDGGIPIMLLDKAVAKQPFEHSVVEDAR